MRLRSCEIRPYARRMGDLKALPAVATDVRYLWNAELTTLNEAERTALDAALIDGDQYLEWTDLDSTGTCRAAADTTCREANLKIVWGLRSQLIARLAATVGQPLRQRWPDLDLGHVATLIEREAPQVPDLFAMTKRLVDATLNTPSLRDFHGNAALLFMRFWLTTYNFGEAHRAWVRAGNAPLPDIAVEPFIARTLARLEQGAVRIEEATAVAHNQAEYNFLRDAFGVRREYLADPLHLSQASTGERHWVAVTLHELFHSEYDAQAKPIHDVQHEIAATLFGFKALVIVVGEVAAERHIRDESGAVWCVCCTQSINRHAMHLEQGHYLPR